MKTNTKNISVTTNIIFDQSDIELVQNMLNFVQKIYEIALEKHLHNEYSQNIEDILNTVPRCTQGMPFSHKNWGEIAAFLQRLLNKMNKKTK